MKIFRKIPWLWRMLSLFAAIVAILWLNDVKIKQTDLFGPGFALLMRADWVDFDNAQMAAPRAGVFAQTALFRTARRDFFDLQYLFRTRPALWETVRQAPFWVGYSLTESDSLHGLWLLTAPTEAQCFESLISNNPSVRRAIPHETKGEKSYEIQLANGAAWTVACREGFLLMSPLAHLTEDALTGPLRQGLWGRRLFEPLSRDPEKRLELFVDPESLRARLATWASGAWKQAFLPILENFDLLTLRYGDSTCAVRVFPKKTLGARLKNLAARPFPDAVERILPARTAFWSSLDFKNEAAMLDGLDAAAAPDFRRFILPWAAPQPGWGILSPVAPNLSGSAFIALPMRDTAAARQMLEACGRQYGFLKRYDYQTFKINQWAGSSCLEPLTRSAAAFRTPAWVQLENHIVFAPDPAVLELLIDQYVVGQTLGNNPDYLLLKASQKKTRGIELFLDTQYAPALFDQILDPTFRARNSSDLRVFAGVGLLKTGLSNFKYGFLNFPLETRRAGQNLPTPGVLWKTALDSEVLTGPFVVKTGKGAERILVQDAFYNLYCIDPANGVLHWRRKLPGRLLSQAAGIDFYADSRGCYLMNTAEAILLLDDDGKPLEGFPLSLQTPASGGVMAIDFDGNKRHCFFVACRNGNLYGFDPVGNPLPGWNPQGGVGAVLHPIQRLAHGGKDYLIALNTAGKLFAFGRNGDRHFEPPVFKGHFNSAPAAGLQNGKPRFVCFNDAGAAWVCNAEGKSFSINILEDATGPAHGLWAPIFGALSHDFIVAAGTQLVAKTYAGDQIKESFRMSLPIRADTLFRAGGGLGALDRARRNIIFINGQGKLTPPYPLAGDTQFVIVASGENRALLVAGSGGGVYAYLLPG